jgi:hypothetical protein
LDTAACDLAPDDVPFADSRLDQQRWDGQHRLVASDARLAR